MAFSVEMPALGESVTEGTVTRWLKQEGDTVEVDEPLLEVSTDKVDTEIPSPAAGVLQKIVAQEDDTVEVGGELAVIGDADDDGSDDSGSDESGSSAAGDDAADSGDAEDPDEPSGGSSDSADADAEEQETVEADAEPTGGSGGSGGSGGGAGTTVEMPALGESVTEGTVTRWLKSVGDTVEVDEPLLEVSTDKVDTEIPSPVAGTLLSIAAEEDETVEVGGALATIGDPDGGGAGSDDSGSSSGGSGSSSSSGSGSAAETPLESEEKDDEAARAEASEKDAAKDSTSDDSSGQSAAKHAAPDDAEGSGGSSAKQAEKADAEATGSATSGHAPATAAKAADDAAEKNKGGGEASPYVTPLVRKLAAEKDVDLSAVSGTGVGGRIRKQDVLAAAEEKGKAAEAPAEEEVAGSSAPAPAASSRPSAAPQPSPELAALRGTVKKASRIRQITATKTRESLQTTAQLTQVHEVDMSRVVALRARAKKAFAEREGVNLTYLPFFAKAVVEALKAHPNVNASYDEGSKEITYHAAEHLGIAVDTERGLLSPVIHNAGDLSIGGLARAIADIADKARTNKLTPEQLSGGTFTITNIGSQGALIDTPILVPPQSAMLGTGAIVKRPVVVTDELGGDTIAVRSVVYLPLTYDHRLVDGADAGRFLSTVKRRLEEAAFEGDLGL